MNIANILSCFRLVAAPMLLYLAWSGKSSLFLCLLVASLISDVLDGQLARHYNWTSELGTKLDSWGDLATYMSVPLCAWWLWPNIILREMPFVLLTIGAYTVPIFAGFLKFKRLPSYHTWGAKIGAVIMGISALVLFTTQISLPFRIAAIFQGIVALEEVAITIILKKPQSDIPFIWNAIAIPKRERTSDET